MATNMKSGISLLHLDIDILLALFEELRPQKGLRPLLSTCRRLREDSKPVLFRKCRISAAAAAPVNPKTVAFLPESLWPHVQHLIFYDVWSTWQSGNTAFREFPLAQTLACMPRLRAVSFEHLRGWGAPLVALQSVLGTPQLRHFDSEGSYERKENLPQEALNFHVAPLTTFHHVESEPFRLGPRHSRIEEAVFRNVIHHARDTLQSLRMPIESAPLDILPAAPWRSLRRLSLTGLLPDRPTTPLVTVLGTMRELRVLTLALIPPRRGGRQAIWPNELDIALPWPHLQKLMVTFPDPADGLYRHLPHSLEQLWIRCWPRSYVHDTLREELYMDEELGWGCPIPSASEMLRTLRKCDTQDVADLDIEFQAGEEEGELFRHLARGFPNLTHLTLHRYPAPGSEGVPVTELANALAPLARLRILRVYLQAPQEPRVFGPARRFAVGIDAMQSMADTFAHALHPSLEFVCFLLRRASSNTWIPYRVYTAEDGERKAKLDKAGADERGVWLNDDLGPSQIERQIATESPTSVIYTF